MALTLGDNFSYGGAKPLDARLKYSTTTEMKAVADATMYDGCLAYCTGTDKTYQWKSTNTVDETLGRWREFSSGGGSTGGGHTIEDSEGTDLTQRDTLQFGEGFLAKDDDTNEKTVISPDVMQSGDMDDVVTPLPSVSNKMPVLFDDSGTERVIGYALINGVKKEVYEKTIDCGTMPNNNSKNVSCSIGQNVVEKVIFLQGICGSSSVHYPLPLVRSGDTEHIMIRYNASADELYILTSGNWSNYSAAVTMRYIKSAS